MREPYNCTHMEYKESESKEGMYRVYISPEGKKFYVLQGLSIDDQVASPPLQQLIHEQYVGISTTYWILLGSTLVYLLGMYIVLPIMRRYKLY